MKPGVKLAAFSLVLAVAFGGGAAAGAAFGPDSSAPNRSASNDNMLGMNMTTHAPAPAPAR